MGESEDLRAVIRFLVPPADGGVDGTVDGGTVMEWIDKAGYAAAGRWSGSYCMSVAMGDVRFHGTISPGELVEVDCTVVLVGRTSMTVRTEVRAADPRQARFQTRASGDIVYVAVDAAGSKVAVPAWRPRTSAESVAAAAASERATARHIVETAVAAAVKATDGAQQHDVLRFISAPSVVNWAGRVHGGAVMHWMDQAGAVCAAKWQGAASRASYASTVRFLQPIRIGQLVEVDARVVAVTERELWMLVQVRAADVAGGAAVHAVDALWARTFTDADEAPDPRRAPEERDSDLLAQITQIDAIRARD